MTDLSKRLMRCFSEVFPALPEGEIQAASTASLSQWDSVAHITLLAAVAEEFGVEFEIEEFEEATSFPLILDLVGVKLGTNA